MTHDMHNGEHTEEWPAADLPLNADDSDAPVNIDESIAAAPEGSAESTDFGSAVEADDDDAPVGMMESSEPATTADEQAADDDEEPADGDDQSDVSAADVLGANNVDIKNGGARDIEAQSVSITQGGARDIDATTVTINQGGAARISAEELSISQGGVGIARTEHLTLHEGGNAFAVLADKATLDPETSVFLLIAGSTSGDVRPVLDWRAAAAFGAGFAFVLALLRRVRR